MMQISEQEIAFRHKRGRKKRTFRRSYLNQLLKEYQKLTLVELGQKYHCSAATISLHLQVARGERNGEIIEDC